MDAKTVLIVDDSVYMRAQIKSSLVEKGFEVVGEAKDGESAIDMAMETNPDLITLDNILPDMMGLDVLKTLKEGGLESKILMISAVGQDAVIAKSREYGATDYIVKPFTAEKLIVVVESIS